jgi:hypothetical protein
MPVRSSWRSLVTAFAGRGFSVLTRAFCNCTSDMTRFSVMTPKMPTTTIANNFSILSILLGDHQDMGKYGQNTARIAESLNN